MLSARLDPHETNHHAGYVSISDVIFFSLFYSVLCSLQTSACGQKPAGIVNSFMHIVEDDGIRGLYRGMGISLAVAVPNLALGTVAFASGRRDSN